MSNPALLSGSVNSTGIFVQGRVYEPGLRDYDNSINRLVTSTNFFETMEIPILLGRGFTARDTETSPKVAVINEAAAKKYFPNENPIGQHFGSSIETVNQLEVVGVLKDAKYNSVRDPAPPTMYVPYLQTRAASGVIEVRTAGDPTSVDVGRARGRSPGRSRPADDGRVDAARTGRAAFPAGEAVRPGLHALRRAGDAGRGDRAVRPDVVHRLAPHQRDRHPHGARRAARRRDAAGAARVDDARRDRRRHRRRRRARRPADSCRRMLFGLAPTRCRSRSPRRRW